MLFMPSTAPKMLQEVMSKHRTAPNLAIFDEFKDPDKPPCMKVNPFCATVLQLVSVLLSHQLVNELES